MPFLDQALLRYIIELSSTFELVVPNVGGMREPLHAAYSKSCLPSIEHLMRQNKLRVSELFDLVKVRYVEEAEIDRFDPQHLSFFNINTEADLEQAKVLAQEKA